MGGLLSINSPFWRLMDKMLHLLWLNLLWFLCCLPIFTIGAATTALYSVTLKYAKNQEGYITHDFLQSFKDNFFQSTLVWFVMAGIGIFLGLDLIVYLRSSDSIPNLLLMTAFFASILIYIFVNLYVYAIIASFRNTTRQCLKNALILSVWHWPTSLLMISGGILIFLAGMLLFPPLLFVGYAGFCYLCSKYFNKLFGILSCPISSSVSEVQ